ncbi:MAG: HEPN domain-containing protein [Nanoarchaeota archaeon]|nr:HEPN domain-containing protein [Nanoarchaeota archaeon]
MPSEDEYGSAFARLRGKGKIIRSSNSFKIGLFLEKGDNTLDIAEHLKDIKPEGNLPKRLFWDYWAITLSYYAMLYAAKAAILSKGYEVSTHDAAQVALGHLLVPGQLEREDLELLRQSHKIFEDEYVKYFEDAKKESRIARYSAIKTYTRRRLEEIFDKATRFVAKIRLILG